MSVSKLRRDVDYNVMFISGLHIIRSSLALCLKYLLSGIFLLCVAILSGCDGQNYDNSIIPPSTPKMTFKFSTEVNSSIVGSSGIMPITSQFLTGKSNLIPITKVIINKNNVIFTFIPVSASVYEPTYYMVIYGNYTGTVSESSIEGLFHRQQKILHRRR